MGNLEEKVEGKRGNKGLEEGRGWEVWEMWRSQIGQECSKEVGSQGA